MYTFSYNEPISDKFNMKRWRGKYCIVVPVQFRVSGVLIARLLNAGINVIALTNFLKRAEILRSQMPWELSERFISHECDLHSISSMRATFIWIKENIGEVHLLIYLLPKMVQNPETLYTLGMEHRMQQFLDVSLESARTFLRQAERYLFPACCCKYCNSENMWIVRYNLDEQEHVVDYLLKRMSQKKTLELCKLRTLGDNHVVDATPCSDSLENQQQKRPKKKRRSSKQRH